MTGRERIVNAVSGKNIDKTPISPFVYSNVVKEKFGVDCDVLEKTVEFYNDFSFDVIHRNFNIRHSEFDLQNKNVLVNKISRGNVESIETKITVGKKTIVERIDHTMLSPFLNVTAQTECFLKDAEDLDYLIEAFGSPIDADFSPLKRAKKLVGNLGVVAPWCDGVFNYMSKLRKLDDLLIDPYVDFEFYDKLANYCVNRLVEGLGKVLDEGVDFISLAGNIASGKLVGDKYFEEFVLPYEKKLVDYIQSRCLGVIYHNCGYASNMIDVYNKLNLNVYETMTEPPFADNDFETFAEKFNSNTCLMGNIDQINFLKNATAEQVRSVAIKKIEIANKYNRKFILGTSDFLEENTPKENLIALSLR